MKNVVIVTGGSIDDDFACRVMEQEQFDLCIAADSGMDFFYRTKRTPHIIIGDFDSAHTEALSYFRGIKGVTLTQLNPVKDDTDTEAAIRLAIREGATSITLLGATGCRLDHVLGNIALLGIGLSCQVPIMMLDPYNRIRMIDRDTTLVKKEQYGKYVSLVPYAGDVDHVTLKGFRYPLNDHTLPSYYSLGISNEIVADEGQISFPKGTLLVIESRDQA
jgi:thiamine pyrophosphokinase